MDEHDAAWYQARGALPVRTPGRLDVGVFMQSSPDDPHGVSLRFSDAEGRMIFQADMSLIDFAQATLANRGNMPVRYWRTTRSKEHDDG